MTTHRASDHTLPESLPTPSRRALAHAGYERLGQVATASEADLLRLHGVGPLAIERLRQALQEHGMTFTSARDPRR